MEFFIFFYRFLIVDYLDKLNLRFKRKAQTAEPTAEDSNEDDDSLGDYDFESDDSDVPKSNGGKTKRSTANYLERELQSDVKNLDYNLK